MYYKVVVNAKSGLHSVCVGPKYMVYYTPDVWTSPTLKGSKLYIFTSLEDAIDFADKEREEVWECEAEDVTEHTGYLLSDMKLFWERTLLGEHVLFTMKTPVRPSAKLASRVKLTKCVQACVP